MQHNQSEAFINDIIRLSWTDNVSFEKIKRERGISETEVIKLMRKHMKLRSFKLWRERVSGRISKHEKRAKLLSKVYE